MAGQVEPFPAGRTPQADGAVAAGSGDRGSVGSERHALHAAVDGPDGCPAGHRCQRPTPSRSRQRWPSRGASRQGSGRRRALAPVCGEWSRESTPDARSWTITWPPPPPAATTVPSSLAVTATPGRTRRRSRRAILRCAGRARPPCHRGRPRGRCRRRTPRPGRDPGGTTPSLPWPHRRPSAGRRG